MQEPDSASEKIFEAFSLAVDELSEIPFFPKELGARLAITEALMRFVAGGNELQWLIHTAVDHLREWRGVAELRALYCTQFRPLDGKNGGACQIAGFTPEDCEREFQKRTVRKYLPAPEEIQTEEDRIEHRKLQARLAELARDKVIWSRA